MFRRWTPECTLGFVALLALAAVAICTRSEAAIGALLMQCGYCIQKMFEVLKIRLGVKEHVQDASKQV
jgi:hypothetical protein